MSRKPDQKRRIRREAAKLFARNGYDATGVAEIGEAVGMGRGALYHHIGSKEQLLFEIGISHVQEMVSTGEAILRLDLEPQQKFRELARQLMQAIADNLPELTVYFAEHRALTGQRRASALEMRAHFEQVWQAILEQGVEAAVFKTSDALAVKGILGTFNYSYLWLRPDGEKTPVEVADFFCDMLLEGLVVDDAS